MSPGSLNSNIEKMPSQTKASGDSSGTTQFTIPNGYRGRLLTVDSNQNRCGEWYVYATGGGAVGYKNVVPASLISLNTATANRLGITVTDGGIPMIVFDNYLSAVSKI